MMAKIKSRFPIFAHLRHLLKQAEKLEGTSPDVPKFFGSAGALPSKKTICHSPLATRYLT
jgi:hypothetical protein